jgi:phi13 family phage major tail protein
MTAEGESEADVEITGLPLDKQAALLGKVWDDTTGRMFDNGTTPPYVALGYRAKKSGGKYKYYWYLKCQFSPFDEEAASETDTPDPKSTKLKLTSIRTVHKFDLNGDINASVKRVIGDESFDNFVATDWFTAVQVPVAGSPDSLTANPTPVNGADTALDVPIFVVFSNPLAGGAENSISLVDATDDVPVTVTRTLSSDRKTVNLVHDALTINHNFLIVLSNVHDVYGQTIDAVYNFNTND